MLRNPIVVFILGALFAMYVWPQLRSMIPGV